ncbi:MAG: DUF4159 domain-containing protein [Bacteroidota bacterium]|nr:DUF4159 domain-containing protein [Bacteroidota bacterium]
MNRVYFIIVLLLFNSFVYLNKNNYQLAVLKYQGGGDWYSNPSSLKNLAIFCNENLNTNINPEYAIVEVGSTEIYNYPFIHMTGHGNVYFNEFESENLRNYLLGGGFLHIDDNYGMDIYVRSEMKKVFPELDFIEITKNHKIYNMKYKFKNGLPKIHAHDNKNSQAFGLIKQGRLICLYTYECDLGDGWEDANVHQNSFEKREQALKMGANIIEYVMTYN